MPQKLGELKKLNPRAYWRNESSDFTPWLASEPNMERLGQALGMELEVESTEVSVGPFSADILARDTASSDYVVIENQLGKTDHEHLGKLLTYAAALDARTVVWIAADFTEEHRKALDWLNANSSEDIAYYGVRLELWQIDDSAPAVQFNVISRPAEFSVRGSAAAAPAPVSEARKLQYEWWTAFREALLEAKVLTAARQARPQYWYDIPLGRTGIHLSNTINTYDNKIGIRVYMRGIYGAETALAQLRDEKDVIEREIGEPLQWDTNPQARDKIIALYRSADLKRRDKWPEYLQWMTEMTRRFRDVFGPRVKMLDLSHPPEEDDRG